MKSTKDVAFALSTLAAIFVALFAAFVSIPVWFEAVVITLAVVGAAATISEIVKAYKASYDEMTGKHTYKFPVRVFVFGALILLALAAIVLLSLKRLYGFALIPVVGLLAILLVIAYLKKLGKMFWITLVALILLVVALIGYGTSMMVKNDIDLNPGISVETTTPDTENVDPEINEEDDGELPDEKPVEDIVKPETPETEVPETETPETEVPETETPETEVPETETPETEVPETETPETEVPETETPETEVPETETPETEVPETETPEIEVPEIKPVVPTDVKINAPETMSFGECFTITLEGCKSDDIRFSNEDYLSIVIVNDNEIDVTLLGYVTDAGEIEFAPASGYITVTDSVSGESVTIDIVALPEIEDEPEIETPETEVPEEDPVEDIVKPVVPEVEPEETVPETEEPEIPEDEPVEQPEEVEPVVVKINAPEVMYYAEPIILTLEGINANDLKFGNEDFLAIAILSDTEVEVTLVGIVNDAGEVEFVPAAGYITVTDAVSGVHVVIEIVE